MRLRHINYVFVLALGFLCSAPLWAQPENEQDVPKALAQALDEIDQKLKRRGQRVSTLKRWAKQVAAAKEIANECIPAAQKTLEKLNQDLSTLGPRVKGEPAEVARQRRTLTKEKTARENRLATCRVIVQRSDELLPRITEAQNQLLAQRLLARGPMVFALFKDERLRPAAWMTESRSFVQKHSVLRRLSPEALSILALLVAVALAIGGLLRPQLLGWTQRHRWQKNLSSYVGQSIVTALAHYMPYLLFSLTAAVFFFFATRDMDPIPFGRLLAYGLPPYFLAAATVHVFVSPFAPAEPFLPVPTDVGRALATRLKVFLLLAFVGYLMFATLLAQKLPEPALLLARGVFAVVFFVNLTWALWLLGRIPALAKTLWLRVGLLLVLLTALVAELLGYRNLSVSVLRAVIGTLIALGLLVLALRLFRELFDGLRAGRHAWHRRLRQGLGLKPGDRVPGLVWMRVITAGFFWAVFAVAALRIWGVSEASMQRLYDYVLTGFAVGSLHVNPARIILALLTLALLVAVSGWFRNRLERKWLPRTRMKRESREALVKISGYTGIAIAILVTLGVSGVEFTNLAIIAGALSVGIGFGLQNIVNNFVSGLILLFERQIKTDDWIVVGNTEGYVKRIRMRSTEIQTFDRADVIVPNSDLISNQVTNWKLHEARGRVKVPVGVAYGSDTGKVRDILVDVAHQHSRVITDGSAPEPYVLFLGFGNSSLDFELRCHIDQIDYRLMVKSDLNFAIDEAFREHGIEIPFPQRDIHVRGWPTPQEDMPMAEHESLARKRASNPAKPKARDEDPDGSD